MLSRISFRIVLPAIQVPVAAGLLLLARAQYAAYLEQAGAMVVWDYTPPAAELVVIFNAPALLLVSMLQFFTLNDLAWYVVFLAGCGVLWYWIGRKLDAMTGKLVPTAVVARTKLDKVMLFLGLVASSLLSVYTGIGIVTLISISPPARISFFLWSLGFTAYFGRKLARPVVNSTS